MTAADALEIAVGAARSAAAILLQRFRGPAVGVRSKSTLTDLVSEADERAEQAVVTFIRQRRPHDELIAEEGSGHDGRSGIRWLVDPLDGTINYLYGQPHWCVSVACADADGAIAGAVYDPSRDELFTATRGGGARLADRPLAATAVADPALALVATGFSYDAAERAAQSVIVARLAGKVRDIRRAGSAALDLAWVAAGRLDAYFEVSRSAWDSAAGELLVREAGGAVTWTEHTEIVVSGRALHAPLVALLRASHENRG
ncbi:MAG: inositol monophosphatase [Chloroflexota bacterium]|nr:inositol monophosphatase [Chloroflexota bacterium]